MASSSEKTAVRGPEKASFSQKCSMLSQYLKEKGSFGDLSLGMTCSVEANGTVEMLRPQATTMNLFPVNEKPDDASTGNAARNLKSMDLFPQHTGFVSSASMEVVRKMADLSMIKSAAPEPETAQMTIFYGGQVIVFNDFPSHKAKEVMALASKGCSQSHTAFPLNNAPNNHAASAPNVVKNTAESSNAAPSSSSVVPNLGNIIVQENNQPPPKPVVGDLPIARRASLHRFLEKRKDRINAKAPYQTNSAVATTPWKQDESKPWLCF